MKRRSSGIGCILFFCLLGLLGCIGALLLFHWFIQPGNNARAAGIVYSLTQRDQEILDIDDPRGVVLRNTINGDITIIGGRMEDTPKWIPILPGARIEDPFSMTCHAQSPERDSFIDGRFELVGGGATRNRTYDFYKAELTRQGFEVENEPPPYLAIATPEGPRKYLLVSVRSRGIHLEYTEWFATGAGNEAGHCGSSKK